MAVKKGTDNASVKRPKAERVAKATPTASKRTPRKAAATKTAKRATRATARSKTTAKRTTKAPTTKTKTDTTEVVTLPKHMPAEAVERSETLAKDFDAHYRELFRTLAYVTSFCFLLLGSVLALSGLVAVPSSMSANVIYSGDGTGEQEAVFYFISEPPYELTGPFEVQFNASYVESLKVILVNVGTGVKQNLTPRQFQESVYGVMLPYETMEPGAYYKLRIELLAISGDLIIDETTTFKRVSDVVETVSEFDFMRLPPDELSDSVNVTFFASYVKAILATLERKNSGTGSDPFTLQLPVRQSSSADVHEVEIPFYEMIEGEYELWLEVQPLSGEPYVERTPSFFHPGFTDDSTATAPVGTEDTAAGVSTTDSSGTVEISNTTDTTSTTNTLSTDEGRSTNTAVETNSTTEEPGSIRLYKPATPLSGIVKVKALIPMEYTNPVELYARPSGSVSSRYVTRAVYRDAAWWFVFDSKNLPNGTYEFFARTTYNSKMVTSRSFEASVSNTYVSADKVITITDTSNDGTTETTEPTPAPLPGENTTTYTPPPTTYQAPAPYTAPIEAREVITIRTPEEGFTVVPEAPQIDSDIERESGRLLAEHEDSLDALLKRYAVAKQSGDESMIKLALDELRAKREQIALASLTDERTRDISAGVAVELEEELTEIVRRIDVFEELRKERSAGASALDTDQDGISDVDEINLYGTDPTTADSDNDGVTDGIEIMRGFNPVDAAPEAIVRFESPKESFGLVREDILRVEDVVPVLTRAELATGTADQDVDTQPIFVANEIRGRGLPNSYVTLYIFSTPTVVTVRTDADGAFVYTFEKELEDGQHDVYVAVTDNTGGIIAQSNPFSFVKEAQAFTPVSAAAGETIQPAPDVATGGQYSVVVGLGILAFGLILLMLGIGLRSKDDEIIVTVSEPDQPKHSAV